MDQALHLFMQTEPAFQQVTFRRLRKEFWRTFPELRMNEERKSYLLHQMLNTHDMPAMVSLLEEVNQLQLKEPIDNEILQLSVQGHQLAWEKLIPPPYTTKLVGIYHLHSAFDVMLF